MIVLHTRKTLEAVAEASRRYDLVLVPGFKDSGPEHWQSLWQTQSHAFQRITQRRWDNPDVELWIAAIQRLLATRRRPALLIGHSLGALASCCVAADGHPMVAGLMLVAPAEPTRFEAEDRVPQTPLGVPSLVIASHNDPVMRFPRAEHWSRLWQADLVDVGDAGHVNAESGFGPWPHGLDLILDLVRAVDRRAEP
ncbi:alpha/beta hydrolase [Siculibacillus lacustris]|uniref:Alpha/beta hydrolase n=1 Tax=Siculibacillus lacustris TaxID=1549641 RepID=A0A4Q9VLH1_9HYPH|nr:alpha/beta hydrolase [Siculibacillus lacustris]TBW36094.1 alpha/beta hydrolase [Siculibacillus lacustris]